MKKVFSSAWLAVATLVFCAICLLILLRMEAHNSSIYARLDQAVSLQRKHEALGYNKDSLVTELSIRDFKEDYYVNQLSIQSDWLIFYVTVLFGIFGLIGYGVFLKKIDDVENRVLEKLSEQNSRINEQKSQQEKNNIEIENMSSGLLESAAMVCGLTATLLYKEKKYSGYINLSLFAIECSFKAVEKNPNYVNKKGIIETISTMLKECLREIDKVVGNPVELDEFRGKSDFNKLIEIIDSVMKSNDADTNLIDDLSRLRIIIKDIFDKKL